MDPTAAPSEVPWQLSCVLLSGVFSATVWGLATLFRPRPSFARAEPEDDGADREEPPAPKG